MRTNAETPLDARTALKFGAEGIGLCRTEHMFFQPDRIVAMQEMILADDAEGRTQALAKILPMQRADFVELFEIMAGLPVTIRLLDPPLHEFLPHEEAELDAVAKAAGRRASRLVAPPARRPQGIQPDARPARLPARHPVPRDLRDAGARDLRGGVRTSRQTSGETVVPEVMIPLVLAARELQLIKERIDAVAAEVGKERGGTLDYLVGTMIELPRAALRAGEIAEHAEFFSFGTNDLTQMTLGLSRDDSGKFLDAYLRADIFPGDPFQTLDRRASASWSSSRPSAAGRRGPTSSSASAASTAATRPRSRSASGSGSTTSPARPTACRSRGWRRRRRRCGPSRRLDASPLDRPAATAARRRWRGPWR